ncbi:hypothetical protein [Bifidobacterium parmae]|uniref:Uncharacterized protein n=1 Tax=Bifidobacterium parmae TaxID=361854 RepID=A0A2N5J0G0_9BIFI|nr:hypothetical protein [Bifidobacterium parmae]PLS27696.1 hypothetical protein Uis4E_1382 [Bifidobacterium parmae]
MSSGSSLIDFRFVRKGDERLFPLFTCTVPVPRNREVDGIWVKGESLHPYPWELLVQRLVRHSALYLSSDNWIRVGIADDGEIATYCAVARKAAGNGLQAKFMAYVDIRNERSARLFHDFGFERIRCLDPDRRGNIFAIWALR